MLAGAGTLVAVDVVPEKLELARELGATDAVRAGEEAVAAIREITGGGRRHAIETVGSERVLAQAYAATRRGGTTVTVGLPHPDRELAIPAVSLVAEERTLRGSYLGSSVPERDLPRFIALHGDGAAARRAPPHPPPRPRRGQRGLRPARERRGRPPGDRLLITRGAGRFRLESGVLADEFASLGGAGRNESIRRAFRVLECLARSPGASVAAVARETGLPRATVTRVLATLADVGAARRDGAGWTLGPSIAELARGADPPLAERAGPQLAALAADLGETVMLAVPEGAAGARVVAEAAGPRMVGVGSWLGRTLTDPASGFVRMRLAALDPPARQRAVAELQLVAHTASTIRSRRALLAELDRVARADHSEVVDEYEQGLAGLAVPLRRHGLLVGLLAVYLPTARLDAGMRRRALQAMRATAQSLTGASDTTTSSSSSQTR